MIKNPSPTRAEANDIYNSLEMGASALVLAAETAIGKYPISCVNFLLSIIKNFNKNKAYNYEKKKNFNYGFTRLW